MDLLVDDSVPHAQDALGGLARVHTFRADGSRAAARRALDASGATLLVVRTTTPVDRELLEATAVQWVGTATIGHDHVDRAWLAGAGITLATAAGCNADAVRDWVTAVVLRLLDPAELARGGPVGVVGLGNTGRRVTRALESLGVEVLTCDPPLAAARDRGEVPRTAASGGLSLADRDELDDMARERPLVALDELLERCAALTLHVPLTRSDTAQRWPTHHLVGARELAPLVERGALLINCARGAVIDHGALAAVADDRARGSGFRVALDVWEGEPELRWELLERPWLALASPHVAGYTREGKVGATRAMHDALAAYLGRAPTWTGSEHLPREGFTVRLGDVAEDRDHTPAALRGARLAALGGVLAELRGIEEDDWLVRGLAMVEPERRAAAFDDTRRGYRLRRALTSIDVRPDAHAASHRDWPAVRNGLALLGARVLDR
jgi:erythronate-4-phosphate dehydrogenase